MLEPWMQRLLTQTGWIGGLVAVLETQWRVVSLRFRAFRKNLLIALWMAAIGLVLLAGSLMAFSALLVAAWWKDYPLQALGAMSVLYALGAFILIGRSVRRIAGSS